MKRILLLDNYDSFTYNLVHMIHDLGYGQQLKVVRNDKITLEEVEHFDKILISPGPGIPEEAGILKKLVKHYGPQKSILGICLGMQGIAEVYGAKLYNMFQVLHGVANTIHVLDEEDYLFQKVPITFKGAHYHSWAVLPESLNGTLRMIARDEFGNIMGISHCTYDVKGLQYHPESILTECGRQMLENWLRHESQHPN